MRLIGTLLALTLVAAPVWATDLFKDGKPTTFSQGDALGADATIGGYAMYRGDGDWRLLDIGSSMSGARGNADSINRGQAVVLHIEPTGELLASMFVATNLTSTGLNQHMTGNPCGGTHLVTINKGAGLGDNCLTVDPVVMKSPNGDATFLSVSITQSRSGGRIYYMDLRLNPELLGLRETGAADWTFDAVKASPEKSALILRVRAWAATLQDASFRALEFNKPQDAFNNVPSFRTLAVAQ